MSNFCNQSLARHSPGKENPHRNTILDTVPWLNLQGLAHCMVWAPMVQSDYSQNAFSRQLYKYLCITTKLPLVSEKYITNECLAHLLYSFLHFSPCLPYQFNSDDWEKQRHCTLVKKRSCRSRQISCHAFSELPVALRMHPCRLPWPTRPSMRWSLPLAQLLLHANAHCSLHSHHSHLRYFIPLLQPSHLIVLLDLHMADTFLNFRSNTTSSERPSLTTLSSSLLYLFFFFK